MSDRKYVFMRLKLLKNINFTNSHRRQKIKCFKQHFPKCYTFNMQPKEGAFFTNLLQILKCYKEILSTSVSVVSLLLFSQMVFICFEVRTSLLLNSTFHTLTSAPTVQRGRGNHAAQRILMTPSATSHNKNNNRTQLFGS